MGDVNAFTGSMNKLIKKEADRLALEKNLKAQRAKTSMANP